MKPTDKIQPIVRAASRIGRYTGVGVILAIASCLGASPNFGQNPNPPQAQSQQWRPMNDSEVSQQWEYVLNSPLGIAALNQLAVEGFISFECPKTFYVNEEFGGFQTLLRVQCPTSRGQSAALAYDEMRVIFNRYESNIEDFEVERVSEESPPEITLPE
ncbi:hypothetical protein [Laspinema olomoucense]|uniref:Uncharacterized protein n=1 Tax=Laspinema olomoucense D3b TaxID=2953688 RepID=A0ABT2N0A8_9CYAN|nr:MULTISPECIES: hypothetical protein [unclassified Laspinema]MCT7974323.1 hypothetical protein [Laspinema sp. D3d]MCT7976108.1 hypothetical protein [Laspinema sp. D3b]MCT7994369.1 hypothetical protein [Laspinema sp. D3c]